MEDLNKLLLETDGVAERSLEVIAWYSVPIARITFTEENPESFHVPYHLSEAEFASRFPEIERALTWNHEVTHFLQLWSTTVGILEFLYAVAQQKQLVQIREASSYTLPLEKCLQHYLLVKPSSLTDREKDFVRWYIMYKYQLLNQQWLMGAIPAESVRTRFGRDMDMNIPNLFGTASLEFFGEELDRSTGNDAKKYPLFNSFSTDQLRSGTSNNVVTPLGSLQLSECFAKSVEFEHLIWFNPVCADRVIREWMFDDDVLTYNAPFRMLCHVLEFSSKDHLPLPWAHLRVFVDLSLMYNDLLYIEPEAVAQKGIVNRLYRLKVHPGTTYYSVLRAFEKVPALRDHKEDILRLYDELCHTLGYPNLETMLKKLLTLIDSFLENLVRKGSPPYMFLQAGRELVKRKAEDPLLFINDLIYSNRIGDLFNSVRKLVTVQTPTGVSTAEKEFPVHAMVGQVWDSFANLAEQFVARRQVQCPLLREFGMCRLRPGGSECCAGIGAGDRYDDECLVGAEINRWIDKVAGGEA